MADASIIDIGGVQWNIKDKEARERVTTLEEKTSANFDYSLKEKEIGTWLNGEKLYRLIIKGTTTTHNADIDLLTLNIKEITNLSGCFNTSEAYVFSFNFYHANNTSEIGLIYGYLQYYIAQKKLGIFFGSKYYFDKVSFTIQLEYTKNE